MLHRFRDRFGTPGVVVAVIALVVALGGTAIAASGALSGKQKKEVEKIAKKFAGKPGAAGANGTNGANGKDGAPGAEGAPGLEGFPGKSVVTGTEATGTANCSGLGGATVQVQGEPATKKYACNGSPWTAGGTLPPNATETGVWAFSTTQAAVGNPYEFGDTEHTLPIPISFPIPLAASLPPVPEHTIYVPNGNTTTAHCSAAPINGTVSTPKAESGYLCVYGSLTNAAPETLGGLLTTPFAPPSGNLKTADTSGTSLLLKILAPGEAGGNGSWAVTG